MQGHPEWRSAVAITCSLAVIFIAILWNLRKGTSKKSIRAKGDDKNEIKQMNETSNCQNNVNKKVDQAECPSNDTILELPNPKWVKVGQIQELYMYPLKSGRGKDLKECHFTECGISLECEGRFTLRDRMFLVYNEETSRFQTARHYPTLLLVGLSAVDEFKVKLEAVGMPSVVFRVPNRPEDGSEAIQCTMWWGEPVKCIDCGPEPAEWLSRFLTGTNSGLRLGCALIGERRNVFSHPWEKFTKVYKTLRNEDTGLLSDLASYMLMTTGSVEQLNEKLDRPVPALQFRPNILVSAEKAFAEDSWEWMKIGEHAVIRNVKPCARCRLVKVNPETGTMDEEEPLKTLKSFREQTDDERMSVDGKAPTLGIYCGLYIAGKVNIGDDVFVHESSDSIVESNHQ